MAPHDPNTLLDSIRDQRANKPLSILTLAEPIISEQAQSPSQDQPNTHNDSSTTTNVGLNPQTLTVDLQHYRELFSKLRFSYLEQVTKEKYLRSIVGDPPVLVTQDENLALETKVAGMKTALKAKKQDNERLVGEMEALAARIAEQHDRVDDGVRNLEALPAEIAELEAQVQEVKDQLGRRDEAMELDGTREHEPRMTMSLVDTRAALDEQRRKIKDVDDQIAALQRQMPARVRDCERAERDLEELEGRRNEAARLAMEVRRVKEQGGRDILEERGRWLKGEEAVLRGLLGVGVET